MLGSPLMEPPDVQWKPRIEGQQPAVDRVESEITVRLLGVGEKDQAAGQVATRIKREAMEARIVGEDDRRSGRLTRRNAAVSWMSASSSLWWLP